MLIDPRSPLDRLLYPHECFTALREGFRVRYEPNTHFWEVTDYDLVRYVVSEHGKFSSESVQKYTEGEEDFSFTRSLVSTDPPRHHELRTLVSQAFTPNTIEQLTSRIEAITHDLLDTVVDQGKMDVMQDLSYPLPVTVIAEMLGVPREDCALFKHWSDELASFGYEDLVGGDLEVVASKILTRLRSTATTMNNYFRQVIAQRRKKPASDLVSALLAAQIDGRYLSEDELLGFCSVLLIASHITATNLIGNAILCFDEHPEAMAHLRAQPELMSSAVEEVLRYRPPVVASERMSLSDVELAGVQIKRGQMVLAWLACANHDPRHFPHPERFDIERYSNHHLTFGHGTHFCLGAPLARLEARIALTIMLERFSDIERDRLQDLVPVQTFGACGAKCVPITFRHR